MVWGQTHLPSRVSEDHCTPEQHVLFAADAVFVAAEVKCNNVQEYNLFFEEQKDVLGLNLHGPLPLCSSSTLLVFLSFSELCISVHSNRPWLVCLQEKRKQQLHSIINCVAAGAEDLVDEGTQEEISQRQRPTDDKELGERCWETTRTAFFEHVNTVGIAGHTLTLILWLTVITTKKTSDRYWKLKFVALSSPTWCQEGTRSWEVALHN